MTYKQIIIDGVDVSGCENFSCGICEEAKKIPRTINHFTADCRMYPNCYYKQLQREKQNSQESRDTAIKGFNRAEELKTVLKRKEQECKDLREEIKDIANLLDLDTGEEYNFGNIELEIKQLKAKEQECEELREEKAYTDMACEQFEKQLQAKEQENEKLKARLTPFEDSYFNGLSSIEIAGLAKKSIRITSYNRQLETALEDIRQIVEFAIEETLTLGQKNATDMILQIITEAIGE